MNPIAIEPDPFSALEALSAVRFTRTQIEANPFQALGALKRPETVISRDPFAELAALRESTATDIPPQTAERAATSEKRTREKIQEGLKGFLRNFAKNTLPKAALGFSVGTALSTIWPEGRNIIHGSFIGLRLLSQWKLLSKAGAGIDTGLDKALSLLPQNRGKETLAKKWKLFERIATPIENVCSSNTFMIFGIVGSQIGPDLLHSMVDKIAPQPESQVILEGPTEGGNDTLGPPRPHFVPGAEAQTQVDHPSGGLSTLNPDIIPGQADATVPSGGQVGLEDGTWVPDRSVNPDVQTAPSPIESTTAPTQAVVSGSAIPEAGVPLTYGEAPWQLLNNGVDNTLQLVKALNTSGTLDQSVMATKLQESARLWSEGLLDPTAHPDLWRLFHLSNGTESVFKNLQNADTLKALQNLGILK